MSSNVKCRADIDVIAIAERLGLPNVMEYMHGYWDGSIHVEGATQDQLESAVANYDHLAALRRRKMARIRTERGRRLAETDWMALRSRERGERGRDRAPRARTRCPPGGQFRPVESSG